MTAVAGSVSRAIVAISVLVVGPATVGAEQPPLTSVEAHTLARRGKLLILDVRSPVEWRRTGLPAGAVAIDRDVPIEQLFARVDRLTRHDKAARIAVICAVGVKSAEVRTNLEVAGYSNVRDIADGIDGNATGPGWLASRLPVKRWSAK